VYSLDNIQLEVGKVSNSTITITVTGPAYFIADYGELIAWIGSALLTNTPNIGCYCQPLITKFRVHNSYPDSTLLKSQSYCNIDFELVELETADKTLPMVLNISRDLLGENILSIQGFPIRRRPEGYNGLELSFNSLLYYLQAPNAEMSATDVFVKGLRGVLKLVKHTDKVFLWRFGHSLGDSPYYMDHQNKVQNDKGYGPLDDHILEDGRHIIDVYGDIAAPVAGMYQTVLTLELRVD
jgi:hypothetical protein